MTSTSKPSVRFYAGQLRKMVTTYVSERKVAFTAISPVLCKCGVEPDWNGWDQVKSPASRNGH